MKVYYIYTSNIYVNETIFKGFHADRLESRDSITVARIIFLSVEYITQPTGLPTWIRIQLIVRDPELILTKILNLILRILDLITRIWIRAPARKNICMEPDLISKIIFLSVLQCTTNSFEETYSFT